MADFSVKFSESNAAFGVKFEGEKNNFSVGMAETHIIEVPVPDIDVETYSGAYEVTPETTGQTLKTAQKYMEKNVEVRAIPYYEVSNPSGGNTVYIGTEVLING